MDAINRPHGELEKPTSLIYALIHNKSSEQPIFPKFQAILHFQVFLSRTYSTNLISIANS